MDAQDVRSIVQKHSGQRGSMISILEDVQEQCGYLPADAIEAVADATGRSLVDVYGIATFYRSFSLKPRGKHVCTVCVGTACHVRGAPAVAGEFEKRLDVARGETTADGQFTLETVNCLGACALGPIVVVDGHYFSNVSTGRVKDIVQQAQTGLDAERVYDERVFLLSVRCPRCNHTLMDAEHQIEGHASIALLMSSGYKQEWLRLSALYGTHTFETESGAAAGSVPRVFCPHCIEELRGGTVCLDCEAPFVPLIVEGGAILQVCSRLGCTGHLLDLSGVNS
jgi:NADH-quinone oxidoreductase subunit E